MISVSVIIFVPMVFIIFFIIIGNIGYLLSRRQGKE